MNKNEQKGTSNYFMYGLLPTETLKTPLLQENEKGSKLASEISSSVT